MPSAIAPYQVPSAQFIVHWTAWSTPKQLKNVVWEKAVSGTGTAIDRARRIIDLQARITGVYVAINRDNKIETIRTRLKVFNDKREKLQAPGA